MPSRFWTSSPAAADPALWKAHGKGDVYLFGSVHVLPKDVNWHTPAIDAALDSAKVIVLEVSSDELLDLSLTLGGIDKFGRLPAGQTISSQLPPDKAARFREIVTKANLPFERVDALRPWLVAMSLAQMSKKRKVEGGYYELDQEVWTAGGVLSDKEMRGLETLDEHFRVLSDLSKSEELRVFRVRARRLRQAADPLPRDCRGMAARRYGDAREVHRRGRRLGCRVPQSSANEPQREMGAENQAMLADGQT